MSESVDEEYVELGYLLQIERLGQQMLLNIFLHK
jgi:hypothetical protein